MPMWLQILLALGGSTIIGFVVTEVCMGIKKRGIKYQSSKKQERQNEFREVVHEEVEPLKKDIKTLKNGTQAGLRNDILTCFYKCEEKGYKTHDDAENFRDMYKAYHELGGNSFIDNDIVPAFNHLPLKPNKYVKSENTNTQDKITQ